ncbi:Uncharacterized protein conserved in bacteria [Serratia entomophila]|uniref:glycoside hydrolase family 10 protein n=1 Tax=Serratia entomophila TaxID=42906 RepID=UPI002179EE2F|nr:glycoside hydrolase family 10 protein [Serratia entomophila]CAI0984673.1 Uncharacterized protein conserved in bacteria [Serratia entomophila]CAI1187409.1 Uncharacterized protein conserved in bacteria [Serratia entomophila]CAI2531362.1 Uncharacterized protein conserved in bacteria [Serratia entomophila]
MSGYRRILLLICAAWLLAGCEHERLAEKTPAPEITEAPMRGVWLTTVLGLDWPPRTALAAETDEERVRLQKKALTDKLDNLVKIGANTVFFQVKPDGTAFYRSAILPWSALLSGKIGKDPGYDPLAFAIAEAHKRGLKLHAWLNPYRVSMDTRPTTVEQLNATIEAAPASVYVVHHDWIRTASDRFVLDPGVPEARNWIAGVVSELVRNYSLDGVQFDDYFYYETAASRLDDDASYRRYGRGFPNKGDWRRNNTLLLIQQVSAAVRSLKPGVAFGVSPAGVWRNAADDPQGSATRAGAPSYDTAYADTRQWVQLGLLDYIAPQLYWPFAREVARYDVLAKWWAETVRETPTHLYIGMAWYKVGVAAAAEPDWAREGGVPEIKRQLDMNDVLPEIGGTILFREAFLDRPQTQQAVQYLKSRWRE